LKLYSINTDGSDRKPVD